MKGTSSFAGHEVQMKEFISYFRHCIMQLQSRQGRGGKQSVSFETRKVVSTSCSTAKLQPGVCQRTLVIWSKKPGRSFSLTSLALSAEVTATTCALSPRTHSRTSANSLKSLTVVSNTCAI